MTTPQAITSEIQKLEPSAIIELFELDATAFGGDLLRFHAGTNGLRQNLVWQGNTYTAFPVQASGFDLSGNGQLPRPKLQVANITGAITLLVLTYDDLLGAKVTRKRTLAKYLDAVNFPARRNLLTSSEQIDNAGWAKNGVITVTPNTVIAPDGSQTGDTLARNTSPTGNYADLTQSFVVGAGGNVGKTYTVSIWLRTASGTGTAVLRVSDLFFNTQVSGSLTVTSEWQRFTFTSSGPVGGWSASGTAIGFGLSMPSSSTLFAWGAQLEQGSAATDYQPVGTTWSQNPTADPTAEFADDVFFIDRKVTETRDLVEFELAAVFDVAGVQLPRRQIIQNVCTWRYRGTECGYTGTNYFDATDQPVGSAGLDVCAKRLSSCEARFGTNSPLPFGSFPAAGLTR